MTNHRTDEEHADLVCSLVERATAEGLASVDTISIGTTVAEAAGFDFEKIRIWANDVLRGRLPSPWDAQGQ